MDTGMNSMDNKINTYNTINQYKVRALIITGCKYLVLTGIALICMVPVFWMLSTSLKTRADIFAWPPKMFPAEYPGDNYC